MSFFADLHVHSKFSRATSKDSDLVHTAKAAREKGIEVVGTGDFTHPGWFDQLKSQLEPAEPGLFKLKEAYQAEIPETPGSVSSKPVRFMLQVEISTIYKKGSDTRKLHHLVFVPSFEKAEQINNQLAQIGNLEADGRPILGLDSRDLLEIVLEADDDCYLVPAHIWTPWFALFGSKSGFDSIDDCYEDLTDKIFALETGLSSDPPMNWRLSDLDEYTLVSNSDAHSPRKMGREACLFGTERNYFAMKRALETGANYLGTVEFYPEEGKYHLDGHRDCEVRLDPATTESLNGECPKCGGDLTVGVLHRVYDLADREAGYQPDSSLPYRSLIPLSEILSEIEDVGPNTKTVNRLYRKIVSRIGPELYTLQQAPLHRIEDFGRPMVTEAIRRLRNGDVFKEAGYDGEYGRITLFTEDELRNGISAGLLFDDLPKMTSNNEKRDPLSQQTTEKGRNEVVTPEVDDEVSSAKESQSDVLLDRLNTKQKKAARIKEGPLLILAGPGTGKTRTLLTRLSHLIKDRNVDPMDSLLLTFTRRATSEMKERLTKLIPKAAGDVSVRTFHGFCTSFLRDYSHRVKLDESFQIATEEDCLSILQEDFDCSREEAQKQLNARPKKLKDDLSSFPNQFREALKDRNLIDYEGLIQETADLLERSDEILSEVRNRYRWVSVDEYQDVNPNQYSLIRQLSPPGSNLCVIGDPDQAIYGFRGGSPQFFQRFNEDYPSAQYVKLSRNYRSTRTIINSGRDVISPVSFRPDSDPKAQRSFDTTMLVNQSPTHRAEAEFVVKTIENLIGGTTFFSIDSGRASSRKGNPLSFSDVGVLYRTNEQSEVLGEAFDRSGIPYRIHSHQPLIDHPFVKSFFTYLDETNHDEPSITVLEEAFTAWCQVNDKDRRTTQLTESLKPLAKSCESREEFRRELSLRLEVDLWDPRSEGVSLMTLHASKGTEFLVVFIVGCEEGYLPFYWGQPERDKFPEERRLMFVGMNRAEDQLILSHANRRERYGTMRDRRPSRFLDEIDSTRLTPINKDRIPSSRKPNASSQQLQLL